MERGSLIARVAVLTGLAIVAWACAPAAPAVQPAAQVGVTSGTSTSTTASVESGCAWGPRPPGDPLTWSEADRTRCFPPAMLPDPSFGIPPTPLSEGSAIDIPTTEELMAQGMTAAEADLEHARLRDEYLRQRGARRVPLSGPETAGTTLQVAGHVIKLPPDAQLDGVVAAVLCIEGRPCPQTPAYSIVRNGERISVDRTGQVWIPGKPGPLQPQDIPETFAFLREALR